jgi:hypothetical protein
MESGNFEGISDPPESKICWHVKGKVVRFIYDALISPESPLFARLYTIAE